MQEHLIRDFSLIEYHYKDNKLDSLSHFLDCWEHVLYTMLRNHNIDMVEYFYGNTNPEYYENDNIIGLRRVEENMNRSFRIFPLYADSAIEYIHLLENTLENDKPVAMITMFDMLPNYKWYREGKLGINNHHANLVVGFDESHFYVIDHPLVFFKDRDYCLQDNRSIHLVKKEYILKAFQQYCKLNTIEFAEKKDNFTLENLLINIVNEFYVGEFRGKSAIIKCIQKLENNCNVNLVVFDIHLIYARHVLLKAMFEREQSKYKNYQMIIRKLNTCISNWFSLKILIQRGKDSNLISRQIDQLKKILIDEEQFILQLNTTI